MKTHFITFGGFGRTFAAFLAIFLIGGVCFSSTTQSQPAKARFTPKSSTHFVFDSVQPGKQLQQTFYYRNTGSDTLFIQSLELNADSAFTIQFATLTLPPEGEGKVIVQFAPREARNYRGSIAFDVANGVTAPTLALSGSVGETNLAKR